MLLIHDVGRLWEPPAVKAQGSRAGAMSAIQEGRSGSINFPVRPSSHRRFPVESVQDRIQDAHKQVDASYLRMIQSTPLYHENVLRRYCTADRCPAERNRFHKGPADEVAHLSLMTVSRLRERARHAGTGPGDVQSFERASNMKSHQSGNKITSQDQRG
jgi:hypothetical protein